MLEMMALSVAVQPFLVTVHMNEFVPTDKSSTLVLNKVRLLIVAAPSVVHNPVAPPEGGSPARNAVLSQTSCLSPPSIVNELFTYSTVISSEQAILETVHLKLLEPLPSVTAELYFAVSSIIAPGAEIIDHCPVTPAITTLMYCDRNQVQVKTTCRVAPPTFTRSG